MKHIIIVLTILGISLLSCNQRCEDSSYANVMKVLNNVPVVPVTNKIINQDCNFDTLVITLMDTSRLINNKYMDLIHEYITFKLKDNISGFKFIKYQTNYLKYPGQSYVKIISTEETAHFVNQLFQLNNQFNVFTEAIISLASTETITSLDMTIKFCNESFNGFDFNKSFIELMYFYSLEKSSISKDVEYMNKVKTLAVWFYFKNGLDSEELKLINELLVLAGEEPVVTATKAPLDLY